VAVDELLPPQEMVETCVCLGVRRTARLVTRRYEDALRPVGLTAGQFSVLAALAGGPVPLGRLAEALGMDRTTVNRSVQPLAGRGLLESVRSPRDRRVRALTLTAAGTAVLTAAMPLWRAEQAESARLLGAPWSDLRRQLGRLEGPPPDPTAETDPP
jgi:DNA-binding MarR family transcriptional regulator